MSMKSLIAISLIADGLDLLLVGQIPGLSLIIDGPLLALHFKYGGVKALPTLLELIPGVGTLPVFTMAALQYAKKS